MHETVSIKIYVEDKARLAKRGTFGQTYPDLINDLLNQLEKWEA